MRTVPLQARDLVRLRKDRLPDEEGAWEQGSFLFPVSAAWVDFGAVTPKTV